MIPCPFCCPLIPVDFPSHFFQNSPLSPCRFLHRLESPCKIQPDVSCKGMLPIFSHEGCALPNRRDQEVQSRNTVSPFPPSLDDYVAAVVFHNNSIPIFHIISAEVRQIFSRFFVLARCFPFSGRFWCSRLA